MPVIKLSTDVFFVVMSVAPVNIVIIGIRLDWSSSNDLFNDFYTLHSLQIEQQFVLSARKNSIFSFFVLSNFGHFLMTSTVWELIRPNIGIHIEALLVVASIILSRDNAKPWPGRRCWKIR